MRGFSACFHPQPTCGETHIMDFFDPPYRQAYSECCGSREGGSLVTGGKKIGVLLFFYGADFKKRKGKGEEAPSEGVCL